MSNISLILDAIHQGEAKAGEDEAMEALRLKDPMAAELIKLRFFVGLSYQQAAEVLRVSERSAKRCSVYARAWLYERMQKEAVGG